MFVMPILFGIGCAVAMWFAAQSRDADARLMSVELFAMWALANVLWLFNRLDFLPALDWLIGVQAIVMLVERRAKWIGFFVLLIALRLTFHVVDYLTAHAFLVLYIHGLNATFALLLVAVSHAGGRHARDHLLGHFHRLGSWLRAALRASPAGLNL